MENDFIFIKGKNEELSRFEIISYLNSRKYNYEIKNNSKEFLVISLSDEIDLHKMMESLGGTLKIAKVMFCIRKEEIESKLDRIELRNIFRTMNRKMVFGVSVHSEKDPYKVYKLIGNYFKKRLKQEGISSKYFGFERKRKPQLTNVEVIKKNLIEESAEILACQFENKFYIGTTQYVHNPFEFQKRDVGRPRQRTIFSISPRLSNILINLSGAREGDILLDPFCGIGTIIQEAVLRGIRIRGIDIDEKCIEAAKENLKWLSREYKLNLGNLDEKIIVGDARKLNEHFENNSIDAIATEPYLGPPLKSKPSENEAFRIFEGLEDIYEKSLRSMYFVLKTKRRIAMVSPCIRIKKNKSVSFNLKGIATKVGLRVINSFIDAEERHRTFREIFILEKP